MAYNAKGTDKKFNLTISPMWDTKNGNLMGMEITKEHYDALQNVEEGGKLMVKFVKSRKGDTSPHAYLEYITKEEVRQFKAQRAATDNIPQELKNADAASSSDDTL
jgi:hypothetical protein